jgi:hypothetical protein
MMALPYPLDLQHPLTVQMGEGETLLRGYDKDD